MNSAVRLFGSLMRKLASQVILMTSWWIVLMKRYEPAHDVSEIERLLTQLKEQINRAEEDVDE